MDILFVSKDENNLINKIIYSSFREGAMNPIKFHFYIVIQYERFKSFQKYSNDINLGSIATDKFVQYSIDENCFSDRHLCLFFNVII